MSAFGPERTSNRLVPEISPSRLKYLQAMQHDGAPEMKVGSPDWLELVNAESRRNIPQK